MCVLEFSKRVRRILRRRVFGEHISKEKNNAKRVGGILWWQIDIESLMIYYKNDTWPPFIPILDIINIESLIIYYKNITAQTFYVKSRYNQYIKSFNLLWKYYKSTFILVIMTIGINNLIILTIMPLCHLLYWVIITHKKNCHKLILHYWTTKIYMHAPLLSQLNQEFKGTYTLIEI